MIAFVTEYLANKVTHTIDSIPIHTSEVIYGLRGIPGLLQWGSSPQHILVIIIHWLHRKPGLH